MTTPWSYGKIFWTPTVPQLFNAPVVGSHATVLEGHEGRDNTIKHSKLYMLRYYLN